MLILERRLGRGDFRGRVGRVVMGLDIGMDWTYAFFIVVNDL